MLTNLRIAIVDYGAGNISSLRKALENLGLSPVITADSDVVLSSHGIILPGVGAWDPAMRKLQETGMPDALKSVAAKGIPLLGICLGAQLLLDTSEEGALPGLGLIAGKVPRFKLDATHYKIPHMGWNTLEVKVPSPLFERIPAGSMTYFVHSYYLQPTDPTVVSTTTEYEIPFASSVWKQHIFGTQFHPEKSSAVGLQILKNFARICNTHATL